jgi:hypothetical protein
MSEVRNVTIKGDAATAFMGRKTRKQSGGFNAAPGPSITPNVGNSKRLSAAANAFHTGGAMAHAPAPVTDIVNKVVPVPLPSLPVADNVSPSPQHPHVAPGAHGSSSPLAHGSSASPLAHGQQGGAKKKLVLAPSRKVKGKVHLASPSPSPASASRRSKGTRKIRVQLSCMKKRLHRAKTIKSESRQKPIAEVRRILEEAKLVKPRADGKEVPESVLRDIYVDYMHLRNRVL